MNRIHLVELGSLRVPGGLPPGLLDSLAAGLVSRLHINCQILDQVPDVSRTWDPDRNQHYSTEILLELNRLRNGSSSSGGTIVLGIAPFDLYVPILTFVYGEAQMPGTAALVSTYRLRESFYGLPGDQAKEQERLLKEALHELGHTTGLRHCHRWECVMATSNSIDRMDLKQAAYCRWCAEKVAG